MLPSYKAAQNSIGNYQNYIGLLGPERNASERYAGAFTLREIKYPTGGRTTFEYESNDFSSLNPSASDEVPQSTEILTRGFYNGENKGTVYEQELDFSDPYIEAAGKFIPVELTAAFRATGPCKNVQANPSIYFELYEINPDQTQTRISRVDFGLDICANEQSTVCIYCDQSENSQSPIFSYKNTYQLKPQKYIWKAFIGANESNFNDITATYRWLASTPPAVNGVVHNYGYGGGQRIKIIQDFDPYSNSPSNLRRFEYRHQELVNGRQELRSYGKRMGEPRYSYFEFSAETAGIENNSGIEGTPQQGSVVCMDCRHLIRSSESGVNLSNLQGVAVGYSKVTEYLSMHGEFGKIEYEFENTADLIKPFLQPGSEPFPIKPSRVPTYSNPKNGMLIQKTEYNATGTKVHQVSNTNITKFSAGYFGLEKRPLRTIGFAVDEPTLVLYTALTSYFAVVADSRETFFSSQEQPQHSTFVTFEYDNPEHLQLTSSSQRKSNGNLFTTFYKYPADYSNEQCSQVVLQMKGAAFLHANQIENHVVEKLDGDDFLTNQTIIAYDLFGGRILPKTIAVRELDRPLLLSNFSHYAPVNNFTENDFTTLTLSYYPSGNVKEIAKDDDYTVSYLWGYQNHFPIGEFKNASYAHVASVFGDATIDQLSLSTDAQYIRSTFAYRISNVALNQSEIKYFTYNPITGISTSGDQNGITQFYEYDSTGRLVLVRDNNSNIQKHFSYGYKK